MFLLNHDVDNKMIDEEIESIVMTQYEKALDILKANMDKLNEVARVLFHEEKISGDDFRRIMEEKQIED